MDGAKLADLSGQQSLLVALNGRAASEGLLQPGDCVLHDGSNLDPAGKCEVTVLRKDVTLEASLRSHDMLLDGTSVPCFQLLKFPLRNDKHDASSGNGLGIQMSGLRVKAVSGRASTDDLVHVGDLIIAVNGERVEASAASAALHQPSAMPMCIITVVRPCQGPNLPSACVLEEAATRAKAAWAYAGINSHGGAAVEDHGAASHLACAIAAAATSAAADNPVGRVEAPSTNPGGDSAASPQASQRVRCGNDFHQGHAHAKAESVVIDKGTVPASSRASEMSITFGPSRRLKSAEATSSFEPLDPTGGRWNDLPTYDPSSFAAYDPASGLWSDVHVLSTAQASPAAALSGAHAPSDDRVEQTFQSTSHVLDCMVRQALHENDDALLRRLVAAQQEARVGVSHTPPSGAAVAVGATAALPVDF